MQPKIIKISSFFKNVIKITFNCNLFRPYEAVFRQLCTNWNCRTASVRMSVHPMQLHIVVRTKMCLGMNTLSSIRVVFILRRPCYDPSCVGLTSCASWKICVLSIRNTWYRTSGCSEGTSPPLHLLSGEPACSQCTVEPSTIGAVLPRA
jgi:ABC-type uncharacterized transport system permease subunit